MSSPRYVRAVREAVAVPGVPAPYDTVHLTVRYPALPAASTAERMSGLLPADGAGAPYPVAIILPGVNVCAEGYRWLAIRLVEAGLVCVSYDWVSQLFPGQHGLTPGVDLAAAGPEGYGTTPTTPALAPILERLARLHAEGPLAGMLDLSRVGLVGHSAGGTVALQSASPAWFPQVRGVVTYGSHTMASQQLGYPPDTVLASPATVPVLLIAGAQDGVVAASAVRYGTEPGAPGHDPVSRTFHEALPQAPQAWSVRLPGAGHMLPVHPEDPSSARGFLEEQPDGDPQRLRAQLGDLVSTFLMHCLVDDETTTDSWAACIAQHQHDQHTHDQHTHDLADIRRR